MVTIYTITYNEELLIQFMIDHYRQRFPKSRIVVYDNMSLDKTVDIALANGCEIVSLDTNEKFSDGLNMEIKNTCWKAALTDWVLMCDLDELLEINDDELKREEAAHTTIISTITYDMINMEDNFNIAGIKYGVESPFGGKNVLFNKKFIKEINYTIGAHGCDPVGTVRFSEKVYKLLHYCHIHESRTYEKCLVNGGRLSQESILNGWGTGIIVTPFQNTPELIHEDYLSERKKAIKVR